MIKVAQLQYFSEASGRAVLRLHKAFLSEGINSTIISLKHGINDDEKIIQKGKKSKLIAWIDGKLQTYVMRNNLKRFGFFSYPIFGTNVSQMKEIREADYIYIHWALGGFLNLANMEQLAKLKKPIIFFMHDMWPITGGCHHSFTCEKYKSHCFDCQIFPKNKKNDLSFKGFEKKLKFYSGYTNLFFIAPSKWLFDCAKESALTKNKATFYIPNLLDHDIFKPFDKKTAKQLFNLDPNGMTILFGATSIENPYKGWTYFLQALRNLAQEPNFKNITLLIFGGGYKKEIADEIPFKTKFVGHLRDEYSIALIYNAADVFIAPSLADNLPTTILESLNCGTAVVGFNVGGIPDMIKHKQNGYLAKYKDAIDISEGIKFCLENKIKGYNLPEFEPGYIINNHLKLFENIQLSMRNMKHEHSFDNP